MKRVNRRGKGRGDAQVVTVMILMCQYRLIQGVPLNLGDRGFQTVDDDIVGPVVLIFLLKQKHHNSIVKISAFLTCYSKCPFLREKDL